MDDLIKEVYSYSLGKKIIIPLGSKYNYKERKNSSMLHTCIPMHMICMVVHRVIGGGTHAWGSCAQEKLVHPMYRICTTMH